jgi:hypothetical protein
MNLGEILDRTFQIYRSRFLVFAGIAALPALAMFGLRLSPDRWLHGPSTVYLSRRGITLWNLAVSLGFYHVGSFVALLFYPAQIHVTSTTLFGERSSILTALRFSIARWRSYLWVAVLKLSAGLLIPEILIVVLFVGEFAIAALAGSLNNPQFGVAGIAALMVAFPAIAGCVLFLWLGSCLSLAVPACALENLSGFKSLRRSWALSKESRARIMVTWLMILVFSSLLMFSLEWLFRWIFIDLCHGYAPGAATRQLYLPSVYFLRAMISTIAGPIYPIAITLFYYDQRIRLEGYDIERMMDAAGMNAPGASFAGDGPVVSAAEEDQP